MQSSVGLHNTDMTRDLPTVQAYAELQSAYDFFNAALFEGQLPPCLMTLQRKGANVRGYFSAERFGHLGGARADELAMNPMHFRSRTVIDVLSTLVHEMVHVWQSHLGKPGRGGYHNKEWATKMKAVGLHPSSTGGPGGKEVGDRMTHYIVDGGPFATQASLLLAKGYRLSWAEDGLDQVPPGGDDDGDGDGKPAPKDKSNRIKYTCSGCAINAWGKPNIKLVCGDCMLAFEEA